MPDIIGTDIAENPFELDANNEFMGPAPQQPEVEDTLNGERSAPTFREAIRIMEAIQAQSSIMWQYLQSTDANIRQHLPFLIDRARKTTKNYDQELADWHRAQQEKAMVKVPDNIVTKDELQNILEQFTTDLISRLTEAQKFVEEGAEPTDTSEPTDFKTQQNAALAKKKRGKE